MKHRSRLVRSFDGGIAIVDDDRVDGSRQFVGTVLGITMAALAAGGAIGGAAISSHAANKATDANVAAAADARKVSEDQIAENRRQFDIAQGNNWKQYLHQQQMLAPYQGIGLSANRMMAQRMGMPIADVPPPPTPTGIPGISDAPAPNMSSALQSNAGGGGQGGAQAGTPTMVMMRAPNGQQQQVPQDQVAHYQSKGASIVGA